MSPILVAIFLTAQPGGANEKGTDFFEKKIRPVLVEHCYKCHASTSKRLKGGLKLDTRAGVLRGGDSGPVIVPGKPEESLLVRAIRYGDVDLMMPPRSKLADVDVAVLVKWVEMGAPWPDEPVPGLEEDHDVFDLQARKKGHWAWQALANPAVPDVAPPAVAADWTSNPVDRFLLAAMRRIIEKKRDVDFHELLSAERDIWSNMTIPFGQEQREILWAVVSFVRGKTKK